MGHSNRAREENAEASYLQCEKGTAPPPPPVKPTPHELRCYDEEMIADLSSTKLPEPERNACFKRAQQNLRLSKCTLKGRENRVPIVSQTRGLEGILWGAGGPKSSFQPPKWWSRGLTKNLRNPLIAIWYPNSRHSSCPRSCPAGGPYVRKQAGERPSLSHGSLLRAVRLQLSLHDHSGLSSASALELPNCYLY